MIHLDLACSFRDKGRHGETTLSSLPDRGSATLSVEAPILYEKGGAGLHEVH